MRSILSEDATDAGKQVYGIFEPCYRTAPTETRWLARVFSGEYFMNIIFDTTNNICRVVA